MENIDKIVEFDKYCEDCKYFECQDDKGEDPCHECLNNPVNTNSRKPINFKHK